MSRKVVMTILAIILLLGLTANTVFAQAGAPVQPAAEKYFAGGTKNIAAKDLYTNLNDGDKSNDPFMIDIRAAADYANGHIPGAINVDPKVLFTPAELAKLPKDKQIVVNCYTGQTSSQTVAGLRMLGYDAYSLLYGIPSWGTNDKVTYPFNASQSGNYPVSKDAAQLTGTNEAPKPLGVTVEAAAAAYYPGGFKALKASDVYANLNDGDKTNDPVILDVRKAEDYATGHIPGAVNMDPKTMFTAAELAKLPKGKQIVSYCYSGQTASQVTAALRMLGYDAYNMQFGMPAWAIVNDVATPVWSVSKSGNYPLVLGPLPLASASTAVTSTTTVTTTKPVTTTAAITTTKPVTTTAPAASATAAAPKALPTTGLPIDPALAAVGLALLGAGLALRKRS
jgi:rhodanese-related sulfurtransferase